MPPEPSEMGRVTRSRAQARRLYNGLSRWYDLLAERSEGPAREMGLRRLGVRAGERVLEIGVGTGRAVVTLARSVGDSGRVCGIDLSPGMLRIARARVQRAGGSERVDLLLGDAVRLPFRDGSFDALFMAFVLELFDTPEMPIVLGEGRRVLRKAGRIGVASLSRRRKPGLALRLYDWAHRTFPTLVDCRPIHARETLEAAGFHTIGTAHTSMWGMPVEIVVARSGS